MERCLFRDRSVKLAKSLLRTEIDRHDVHDRGKFSGMGYYKLIQFMKILSFATLSSLIVQGGSQSASLLVLTS